MATINSKVLTMADWAKRLDPDGKTAFITEVLSQSNEVLDDMLFKEGNLPTGEQTTIRTGLPNVFYRLINQGTPKSKSTTAQITENAAIFSGVHWDPAQWGPLLLVLVCAIPLLVTDLLQRRAGTDLYVLGWPLPARIATYVGVFYAIVLFGRAEGYEFLYFQF